MTWIAYLIAAVILIAVVILFLNRFYRKATRDTALIRTGAGGQRVIMDGGCLALPFLHHVSEVNMKTSRIEISRAGPKALITGDRLRVDIEVELTVRVTPSPAGIATAAQALGSKAFRQQDLADLIDGRLIDAMQTVAARESMDHLHENRGAYVREVRDLVAESLAQNGLTLESVALRRFDQAPFSSVDENNAFNAVGLRRLAEVIAANKKQRAAIEADADVAVRQSQLDAIKRVLVIEREQEEARLSQTREVERLKAENDAQVAEFGADSRRRADQARIAQEREVRMLEIARDQQLRQRDLAAALETEMTRRDNGIVLAQKRSEEAAAEAMAEQARQQVILAQEAVQTGKDMAIAERVRQLALLRAQEAAEVDATRTRSETETIREQARAEADATTAKAVAQRAAMIAESEGRSSMIAAENTLSDAIIRMRLDKKRMETLPVLVGQMMKPVEKIDSIRISQIGGLPGLGGGAGGGGQSGAAMSGGSGGGDRPLVNQAVDGILSMALQLPAVQKLGQEIGIDIAQGLAGISRAAEAPPTSAGKA
ncbi:flotillin domain-containing protein [Ferrovibrio sp.]|uniref:flotillin family protein n=1 Tax=Ferrovibrio sp. TaxID=1917215 RepID=UPI00311F7D55